jgi:arylsulfatase A-like enzyme
MSVYAAQITRLDDQIGRLMDQIKKMGVEENTLVLFLSDNGGCAEKVNKGKPGAELGSLDSCAAYGAPWAMVSNTPFRRFKSDTYEGGISSPLIAKWPVRIKSKNIMHSQVSHLIDIMPTLLEAAGATHPSIKPEKQVLPLEGRNLLPNLVEPATVAIPRTLCWEHQGQRAVRHGKWKLVAPNKGSWELYDIEKDRTETTNLAEQNPELVKEMDALYNVWAAKCNVVPWSEVKRK